MLEMTEPRQLGYLTFRIVKSFNRNFKFKTRNLYILQIEHKHYRSISYPTSYDLLKTSENYSKGARTFRTKWSTVKSYVCTFRDWRHSIDFETSEMDHKDCKRNHSFGHLQVGRIICKIVNSSLKLVPQRNTDIENANNNGHQKATRIFYWLIAMSSANNMEHGNNATRNGRRLYIVVYWLLWLWWCRLRTVLKPATMKVEEK